MSFMQAIPPAPLAVMATSFLIPYTIAYLVHRPSTKPWRIALYPLGLIAGFWTAISVNIIPVWNLRTVIFMIFWNLDCSTRMAFRDTPPENHPLPNEPFFPRLRSSIAFKAFDLLANSMRYTNIKPSPLLLPRSKPTWRILLEWISQFIFYITLFDIFTYPVVYLAPTTFGSPWLVGGDYQGWVRELSREWGIPVWLVKGVWTICVGFANHVGFVAFWYLVAVVMVGSGVYLPEEWPRIDNHPIVADSLNDFWGSRYHNLHRSLYILLAKPFESLPKSIYLLSIFTISALTHTALFYPIHRKLIIYPYMYFFIPNAIGCMAERVFRKITGKRVGGWFGRIWMWSVILVFSQKWVEADMALGWFGSMRAALKPEQSLVFRVMAASGWGPTAEEITKMVGPAPASWIS